MRMLALALILAPALAQAHILSCGARTEDGRELMFTMYPSKQVQEDVTVAYGPLHGMKQTVVKTTRTSTGFAAWRKDRFEGPGFRLQESEGGRWYLSVNLPAIDLKAAALALDCTEYY